MVEWIIWADRKILEESRLELGVPKRNQLGSAGAILLAGHWNGTGVVPVPKSGLIKVRR